MAAPSGLVDLRARAYDPSLGAFTSRDGFPGVLGSPLTGNRHAYALGNPLRYGDPSGHFVRTMQENPREAASLIIQLTPGLGDASEREVHGRTPPPAAAPVSGVGWRAAPRGSFPREPCIACMELQAVSAWSPMEACSSD